MKKSPLRRIALASALAAAGLLACWSIPHRAHDTSPAPAAPAPLVAPAPSVAPAPEPIAETEPHPAPAPVEPAAEPGHNPATVPAALLFASSWRHEPRPSLAAFDDWADRYAAASAADRAALLAEGLRLAEARRADLADLIQTDPRQAIASTVPIAVRGQLPAEVQNLLEQRIGARGNLALNGALPVPGGAVPEPYYRTAQIGDQEYRAYVYGRRTAQATVPNVSIQGVALDRKIAVSESPARSLEPGETIERSALAGKSCPISGAPAVGAEAGSAAPPAVQVGDKIIPLCHLAHIAEYESQLIQAENAAGPYDQEVVDWKNLQADSKLLQADGNPGASTVQGRPPLSWSTGTKRVLMIRVDFSDLPGSPVTFNNTTIDQAYINGLFNNPNGIADFYAQGSYGLTHLSLTTSDVTGVLRLPRTASSYAVNYDNGNLHFDAENAATAAGFKLANYDRIGVVFTYLGNLPGSQINYGGLGEVQGRRFWVNGEADFRVPSHELGHTYGLMHCNLWQVNDGNPVSPSGSSTEYGDPFGVMGSGNTNINYQFDPWQKTILHWIPDASVPVIKTSGTYRVFRFDHASADTANNMALKVVRNSTQDYWINYRLLFGPSTYPALQTGAYILWGYNSVVQGNLLDFTTPGTNPTDAALQIGSSFFDPASGVTLKPLAKGGTTPNEYLDIEIDFFPHIDWQSTSFAVDQQSGSATVTLLRSGDPNSAISVNYATADGTAQAPGDYTATSGTISWGSGDGAPKTITIPLTPNPNRNAITNFTVTLSSPVNALIGAPSTTVSIAAAGLNDPLYSANNFSSSINKILRQPDGKLLVAGNFTPASPNGTFLWGGGFTRLNADGSLDAGFFNSTGADTVPVKAMALQADGKVVIGGFFSTIDGLPETRIARLNADGTVDTSFDVGAGPNGSVRTLLVQPDGRILVGGDFTSVNGTPSLYVARLNPDGSVDPTFTGPSFATNGGGWHVTAMALQPDNKVVLAGAFYFLSTQAGSGLVRLNPDGSLDSGFNVGGGAQTSVSTSLPEIYALALQPDGSVVVGGTFTSFNSVARNYLARVTSTGAVDFNFAANASGPVEALQIQPDGKILVGGTFNNLAGAACNRMGRLNANGSVDFGFRVGTTAGIGSPTAVNDWSLQPDGSVLAAIAFSGGTTSGNILRVFTGLGAGVSTVQLGAAAVSAGEGQTVNLTATRTGGSTGAISVNYSTQDLGANAGRFTPTSGALSWADGDSTPRTISVPLVNDGVYELSGQVAVNLGAYSAGLLSGAPAQEVITINPDPTDKAGPTLTVTSPANNSTSGPPNVTLTGAATDSGRGNNGIASVTVNGVPVSAAPVTGASTMNWSVNIPLSVGVNSLAVIAKDTAGNPTTVTWKVTYNQPATISTQPAAVSVQPGQSATVHVATSSSGTSNPTLTYQWYQGVSGDTSNPVAGATSASFTFSPNKSGSYWVAITNSSNSTVYSSTVTVMVAVPPTLVTQPAGSTINTGQTATLSVTAGSSGADDPTVSYQWYAGASGDTSQPAASTSASLTTPALTASTSYWVRLANAAGFTTDSNAALIYVNQPPAIVTSPSSSRVNPNASASLNVTAGASGTADSTINYQWYNGQSGDTSIPVGANAASYSTPNLTATASYWVRLTNSAALTSDSSTATISVNQFPVISKQPASVSVIAGNSASLLVTAGSSGTDVSQLSYQWYLGAVGDLSHPVGANSSVLSLSNLTATATYYVRLTNSAGLFTDSAGASVTVTGPPVIHAPPVSSTVISGFKVTLKVGVSSSGSANPTVHYQWYQGESGDTSAPVGTDSPSYVTAALTASTGFWVKVTNTAGLSTRSGTAEIRVTSTALANLVPMPYSGAWGDSIVITRNPHGTTDDPVFYSNAALFAAASYRNIGSGTARGAFRGTLTLQPSGRVITFVQAAALAPGAGGAQIALSTLALGRLPAGEYHLTLRLDTTALASEVLTTDNSYTKHFVVVDPPVTVLAAPIRVRGYINTVNSLPGIDLFWTPSDARGTSCTVQRREYLSRKWTDWSTLGTSTTNSYRETALPAGTYAQYRIQETDGTLVSPFSALSAALIIPAAPPAQKLPSLTASVPVFYPAPAAGATNPSPRVDAALSDTADVFAAVTVTNSGNLATSTLGFAVTFHVDGRYHFVRRSTDFGVRSLAAGASVPFVDVNLGRLGPGQHDVVVQLDSAYQVDEASEANHTQEKQISVPSTAPNLTGLIDPAQGYNTPFIVATQPGATSSAATLTASDSVYVSVALTDLGTALPPARSFNLAFYLDGQPAAALPPQAITPGSDTDWIVQDLKLGPLAAGAHTFSVRVDAEDNVTESSEADNLLSTHFIVKPATVGH